MPPKVSVIMPVYNCAQYLSEAIDSILGQAFGDFEFLIINDGSTDNSLAIIKSYQDKRIKIIDEGHRGVSGAANRGLVLAKGEYIARMDADDISLPQRLARQVAYLDKYKDIDVLGSWIEYLGSKPAKVVKYPLKHSDIKAELLFTCPCANPSMMFRREQLVGNSFFYHEDKAEDYDLLVRMANKLTMANLPEVLLRYRVGVGISTNLFKQEYIDDANKVRSRAIVNFFGSNISQTELEFHNSIMTGSSINLLRLTNVWFDKLRLLNKSSQKLAVKSLDSAFARRWFSLMAYLNTGDLFLSFGLWRQSLKYFWRADFRNKLSNIKLLLVSFRHKIWLK